MPAKVSSIVGEGRKFVAVVVRSGLSRTEWAVRVRGAEWAVGGMVVSLTLLLATMVSAGTRVLETRRLRGCTGRGCKSG